MRVALLAWVQEPPLKEVSCTPLIEDGISMETESAEKVTVGSLLLLAYVDAASRAQGAIKLFILVVKSVLFECV